MSVGLRRASDERGAALVEFALVSVLLVTLVFGIMEAGWAFSQLVEVRNASREGARLAVVDYGDATTVINETCSRAQLSGAGAIVTIELDTNTPDAESVTVSITQVYGSLTSFLDPVFGSISLNSGAEMRVERPLDVLAPMASNPISAVCP
jgi:Flp pilus assembly protein TadG